MFSQRFLLVTNTGITVCLGCLGDILQQNYEIICKRQDEWDHLRTSQVLLTGFIIGPVCHFWYKTLDRFLPGRNLKVVCKKILIDQIVFSPVNIGLFLVMISYLNGGSRKSTLDDLNNKGLDLLKAEWVIWPPAQLVNFLFVPSRFRVLYDNSVSLAFDSYYSYVTFSRDRHRQLQKSLFPAVLESEEEMVEEIKPNYAQETSEELEHEMFDGHATSSELLRYTCQIARCH